MAILAAGIALLGVNLQLQRRNSALESALVDLRAARGPQLGTEIPEFIGTTVSGKPISVRFPSRTLVLVFSARCKPCTENWPSWTELTAGMPSGIPVVYADVTDSVSDQFIEKFSIPRDGIVTRIDLGTKWMFDLRETPETMVLGPGGRVEGVWRGTMSRTDLASAKQALSAPERRPKI